MKMTGNTILITGGSSGIGMELARQLAGDNVVIITGRDQARLEAARAELGNVHVAQSDADDPQAIAALYETLTREFPALNVLVNNAGIMRKISLRDGADDLTGVTREIETNLNGPIRMVAQFLPHLKKQPSPAIVNVSSGLAFVPFPLSPIYSAAKAGVHAFTQALRFQLKNTHVKVFELAPPGDRNPVVQRRLRRAGPRIRQRHGRSQARGTCDLRIEEGRIRDPSGPQQCAENSEPSGAGLCAQSARPIHPGFARPDRAGCAHEIANPCARRGQRRLITRSDDDNAPPRGPGRNGAAYRHRCLRELTKVAQLNAGNAGSGGLPKQPDEGVR
jgi:uncharacterized oxidoreductase